MYIDHLQIAAFRKQTLKLLGWKVFIDKSNELMILFKTVVLKKTVNLKRLAIAHHLYTASYCKLSLYLHVVELITGLLFKLTDYISNNVACSL